MALGTALFVIFAIWLLVVYPRAVLGIALVLAGIVAAFVAALYISEERDRPRLEQEEAARQARQRAAEARIAEEEATLIRDREAYSSADRWIGVAVDTKHCRYFVDLETMAVKGAAINTWIKVEHPSVEPGVYLSQDCHDYEGPRQVSFSCVSQHVWGAWSFTPGMISEEVLRWLQRSPWCAKAIQNAQAEEERQRKAALAAQAERDKAHAEYDKALAESQERSRAIDDELRRLQERIFRNNR